MHMDVTAETGQRPDRCELDRPPGMVEINVANMREPEEELANAVAIVTESASFHKVGVMITRIGTATYVVRAHPAVPYGLVRQQH